MLTAKRAVPVAVTSSDSTMKEHNHEEEPNDGGPPNSLIRPVHELPSARARVGHAHPTA